MSRPDLSVVVIARGPSLALLRLLRSLGRARELDRVEILLGLNGFSGVEGLRRAAARLVPGSAVLVDSLVRMRPGAARNELVRRAGAPVLLFLDDDVEVPRELLTHALELAREPGPLAAGGPNLTPPAAPRVERLAGRVLASPLGTGPLRGRYRLGERTAGTDRNLIGCSLMVEREAFLRARFGEDLLCAEENELLQRLRADGVRLVHDPGLAVFHRRRASVRLHWRQMVKYGIGRGQLLVRRPTPGQLPHLLPAAALLGVGAVALLGEPALAASLIGLYLATLAAESVHLGGLRATHEAFGLLLATHVGYAAGTVLGLAAGGRRSLRQSGGTQRKRFAPASYAG